MSGTAAAVMSEASMASPCSLASHAAAAISRSIGCECPTGVQNCLWKTRGPAAGPSRTSRRARKKRAACWRALACHEPGRRMDVVACLGSGLDARPAVSSVAEGRNWGSNTLNSEQVADLVLASRASGASTSHPVARRVRSPGPRRKSTYSRAK